MRIAACPGRLAPDFRNARKRARVRGLVFGISAFVLALLACGALAATTAQEVPVIKGGLGPCSVNFTVQDVSHKPIYNAKIDVLIRYGFLSLRKTELEIGTNSDGKARVEGLPSKVKKPLQFHVTSGPMSQTITHDPGAKCDASYEVVLGKP